MEVALLWLLLSVAPTAAAAVACPASDSPLGSVEKPTLTTACPADCISDGICVVFPTTHASNCRSTSQRKCIASDTCAFQCIPNLAIEHAMFVTVYDTPRVVDDVLEMNIHWRPEFPTAVDSITVDTSLADSWVGPMQIPSTRERLAIVGNEAANNFQINDLKSIVNPFYQDRLSLPKGAIVPFELPPSLFEDVRTLYQLRVENIKCPTLSSPSARLVYPKLREIDLSVNYIMNITLSSLPDTLQFLNLSTNEISRLDKDSLPKSLPVLDLRHNQISNIGDGVLPLQLQQLFLGDNNLTELPVDVPQMHGLVILNLAGNPLRDINASTLPPGGVGSLDVRNCSLTSVPHAFQSMERMRELWLGHNDLSRDSDLSMLPTTLKTLDLQNCQLSEFPSSLQNLTSLEFLSLARNPAVVSDLSRVPVTLRTLDLRENALEVVPAAIKNLNLTKISLELNPLGQLAPGSFPLSLQNLLMSNTTFREIPNETLPANLVQLQLSDSLLETPPDDLLVMQNLTNLNLASCRLQSFGRAGHKWRRLEALHLDGNHITRFEGDYPALQSLNLRRNTLEEFSISGEPGVLTLYLDHNNLKAIPESIFSMSKLLLLNLTNNPIRNVSLSADQFTFLNSIPSLVLDQEMFQIDCDAVTKRELQKYTVCLTSSAETQDDSRKNLKWIAPIALGIAVVVIMVVMVGRRRRKLLKQHHEDYMEMEDASTLSQSSRKDVAFSIWADEDLIKNRVKDDRVHRTLVLGSGMFGEVWLAIYQDQFVAMKQLKQGTVVDKRVIDACISEIKLLSTLSHPRVVRFIGVMWTKMSDIAMLTEYMDGGDLRSFLDQSHKIDDGWSPQMVRVAISITEAIVYLHSLDAPIIHRDLKSRNVLLDSTMNAKLSDFGISRHKPSDGEMTAGVGTVRWVAPEVLSGQTYNESVDIYSLGVILSEIDTHKLPFEGMTDDGGHEHLVDSAIAGLIVTGALQVSCSSSCPPAIRSLVERCTSFEPVDRPTGVQVAYELRLLLHAMEGS